MRTIEGVKQMISSTGNRNGCRRKGRALLVGASVSLVVLAGGGTKPAMAQSDEAEALEEIVVTGSRITRAGFDTLQPAIQVDSAFIDERGFQNVGDALSENPAFGLGLDARGDQDNFSIGQNFVNVFGLGTARTLTLINGRRVISSVIPTVTETSADPGLSVDMNIIPTALVDRVETVFTGGAPIYGTDAIAGTVNVILKDDYEGFTTDIQHGFDENGDADSFRARGLWGGNFGGGRGNAVVAVEYSSLSGLRADRNRVARRDNAFCENPANTGPADGTPDFLLCEDATNFYIHLNTSQPAIGGDPTDPNRQLRINAFDNFENALKDASGNPLAFDVDGTLRTWEELNLGTPRNAVFTQGGNGNQNPVLMNTPTTNALINPVDRHIFSANAHYDLAPSTRVFVEGLVSRTEAEELVSTPRAMADLSGPAQLRPGIPININDNPFVTDQLRQTLIMNDAFDPTLVDGNGDPVPQYFKVNRSNLDVEGRAPFFMDQDVLRFVAGLEGDLELLGRDWRWDFAAVYGKSASVIQSPNIDAQRFAFALDAVVDPETGDPACRVQVEGIEDPSILPLHRTAITECVPFNPLGFNPLTDQQRDYLIQPSISTAENRQIVYDANIAGNLFEAPAGPVGVAAGITHRREQSSFTNDRSARNALAEFGPLVDVFGKFDTTEVYGEALVPVFQSDSGVIETLEVEGALRYVDNSRTGGDVTWTAGGRLRPNLPVIGSSLMLRGNYTEAIRAPAVTELFLPRSDIRTTANDPCDPQFLLAGPDPDQRRANCESAAPSGVDLDDFSSDIVTLRQEAISGGNPNLENEDSSSWSVGAIFTPENLPGFSWSVDWIDIEIEGAITTLGATDILNACYDSASFPNAPACGRFRRDQNFQVVDLETGFVNVAVREFAGLTSNLSYRFDAASIPLVGDFPGTFDLFGSLFHVAKHEQQVGSGDLDILAGERDNERLQYEVNLRYNNGPLMVLWQTRHIGSYTIDKQETSEFRPADQSEVSAMYINNATFRYQLTDSLFSQLAIRNVFDNRDDPLRAASTAGLKYTDAIGRSFLLSVGAEF